MCATQRTRLEPPTHSVVGGGDVLLVCAGDAVWGVVCCLARMPVLRTCGPGAARARAVGKLGVGAAAGATSKVHEDAMRHE